MEVPADVSASGARRTTALLSLIALTAAALVWQAMRADYHARDAAARVVRDHARVAAAELIDRVHFDIEYYAALPAIRAWTQWADQTHRAEVPTVAEVSAAANPRQRTALKLVKRFFRYRWQTGECSPDGDEACRTIATAGRAAMNEKDTYFRRTPTGSAIAYTASPADPSTVVGFVIDETALRGMFEAAWSRNPLLPKPLGIANDQLAIDVRSAAGIVLFETKRKYEPAFGTEYIADSATGAVLEGSRARASVDAAAFPLLVRGGVPSSSAPFLLAALAITIILTIAAVRQVNNERTLNRMRSDFIASVSHELRTPLTQIRMFAETLLLARVRNADEERRSLEIIDQEARRLSQLVDNVLRMSQHDRGTMRLTPKDVDASRIVRETVEGFLPLANGAVDVSGADNVHVQADPESIRQILLNLLDNAMKYGRPEQTVKVRIERDDVAARIIVEDQGEGIPERDRNRVWRRYERLERDRRSHKPGSGIGLAVVRELVMLQNGSAWIEDAPGGGARFIIELPL
jgi:signal transduction histidine kinase